MNAWTCAATRMRWMVWCRLLPFRSVGSDAKQRAPLGFLTCPVGHSMQPLMSSLIGRDSDTMYIVLNNSGT
jgi:hypothetical protein